MIEKKKRITLILIGTGAFLHFVAAFIPQSAGEVKEYLIYFASAMMVTALIRMLRLFRLSKDPDAVEELEAAGTDERLQFIVSRARALTMMISVFAEIALGLIFTLLMNQKTIGSVLSYTACVQCVIYTVTYRILEKKY